MVTSGEVKQFLRDTCKVEVAGIAPATSFSADDKKRIVATLETLGRANQRMGNANVFDASDFVDDAKAVIVFGRNSFFRDESLYRKRRPTRRHRKLLS